MTWYKTAMSFSLEHFRALMCTPVDTAGLRQTLRRQFSRYARPHEGIPPELVLQKYLGIGPFVWEKNDQLPTRLAPDDEKYLDRGLFHMDATELPVNFEGDYQPANIIYGDDFLDYATGERQGQADVVISNFVYNPETREGWHPHGSEYSFVMKYYEEHPIDPDDLSSFKYFGLSRHLPLDGPIGDIFARGAAALGAKAVLVYGAEHTVSANDFDFPPYVNMGPLVPARDVHKTDHVSMAGYLLLHRDYLAEIKKVYAQQGRVLRLPGPAI
jgi:hypothetical protein